MAKRGPKGPISTSFKPGVSGNPSGYPKQAIGWRKSIRDNPVFRDLYERAAVGKLTPEERALVDPDRLEYLLDQGFGRAPQTVKLEGMISIDDAVEELRGFLEPRGLLAEFETWLEAKLETK